MDDAVLGSTFYVDFDLYDSSGVFAAPDLTPSCWFVENESLTIMAYAPDVIERTTAGGFTAKIVFTTANGFVSGRTYVLRAGAQISLQYYRAIIGQFIARAASIDDVAAKTNLIGSADATVPDDDPATDDIAIVVGDAYAASLGNPKDFTFSGYPDCTACTCWFGVGPLGEDSRLIRVAGSILTSGGATQSVRFELTEAETEALTPDVTYGYSAQVNYAGGERTVARGECSALRKWDTP